MAHMWQRLMDPRIAIRVSRARMDWEQDILPPSQHGSDHLQMLITTLATHSIMDATSFGSSTTELIRSKIMSALRTIGLEAATLAKVTTLLKLSR